MENDQWSSMTIDDLFDLCEQMQQALSEKLMAEKAVLKRRLKELNQPAESWH